MIEQFHPSHLQLAVPVLPRETIHKLISCRRLSGRLAALLAHDASLPDAMPGVPDRLALLPRQTVERAGMTIAALIYGRQLARYVDAASIATIERAIPADIRLHGIRQAARQAARGDVLLPVVAMEATPADLAAALSHTQWRVLARWREMVSPPYRAMAALRLPATGLPAASDPHADAVILHVIETMPDHD